MENSLPIDSQTKGKLINTLRTFAILFATMAAIFMAIVAPIELTEVKYAKENARVPAVFTGAEYRTSSFKRSSKYLSFGFKDLDGKAIEIIDLRPGDFPFSADLFGLKIYDTNRAALNRLEIGKKYELIQTKNGNKYYIESGGYATMITILILSLLWLSFIGLHIYKKRL